MVLSLYLPLECNNILLSSNIQLLSYFTFSINEENNLNGSLISSSDSLVAGLTVLPGFVQGPAQPSLLRDEVQDLKASLMKNYGREGEIIDRLLSRLADRNDILRINSLDWVPEIIAKLEK